MGKNADEIAALRETVNAQSTILAALLNALNLKAVNNPDPSTDSARVYITVKDVGATGLLASSDAVHHLAKTLQGDPTLMDQGGVIGDLRERIRNLGVRVDRITTTANEDRDRLKDWLDKQSALWTEVDQLKASMSTAEQKTEALQEQSDTHVVRTADPDDGEDALDTLCVRCRAYGDGAVPGDDEDETVVFAKLRWHVECLPDPDPKKWTAKERSWIEPPGAGLKIGDTNDEPPHPQLTEEVQRELDRNPWKDGPDFIEEAMDLLHEARQGMGSDEWRTRHTEWSKRYDLVSNQSVLDVLLRDRLTPLHDKIALAMTLLRDQMDGNGGRHVAGWMKEAASLQDWWRDYYNQHVKTTDENGHTDG